MFVPVPILIVIGLIVLATIGWTFRWSRKSDPLLGSSSPTSRPAAASNRKDRLVTPLATLPPEIDAQIRALVEAGRTIEAIKLVRDMTHLGLKESKELVEAL